MVDNILVDNTGRGSTTDAGGGVSFDDRVQIVAQVNAPPVAPPVAPPSPFNLGNGWQIIEKEGQLVFQKIAPNAVSASQAFSSAVGNFSALASKFSLVLTGFQLGTWLQKVLTGDSGLLAADEISPAFIAAEQKRIADLQKPYGPPAPPQTGNDPEVPVTPDPPYNPPEIPRGTDPYVPPAKTPEQIAADNQFSAWNNASTTARGMSGGALSFSASTSVSSAQSTVQIYQGGGVTNFGKDTYAPTRAIILNFKDAQTGLNVPIVVRGPVDALTSWLATSGLGDGGASEKQLGTISIDTLNMGSAVLGGIKTLYDLVVKYRASDTSGSNPGTGSSPTDAKAADVGPQVLGGLYGNLPAGWTVTPPPTFANGNLMNPQAGWTLTFPDGSSAELRPSVGGSPAPVDPATNLPNAAIAYISRITGLDTQTVISGIVDLRQNFGRDSSTGNLIGLTGPNQITVVAPDGTVVVGRVTSQTGGGTGNGGSNSTGTTNSASTNQGSPTGGGTTGGAAGGGNGGRIVSTGGTPTPDPDQNPKNKLLEWMKKHDAAKIGFSALLGSIITIGAQPLLRQVSSWGNQLINGWKSDQVANEATNPNLPGTINGSGGLEQNGVSQGTLTPQQINAAQATQSQVLEGLLKPGIDFSDPANVNNAYGAALLKFYYGLTALVSNNTQAKQQLDTIFASWMQKLRAQSGYISAGMTPSDYQNLIAQTSSILTQAQAPAYGQLQANLSSDFERIKGSYGTFFSNRTSYQTSVSQLQTANGLVATYQGQVNTQTTQVQNLARDVTAAETAVTNANGVVNNSQAAYDQGFTTFRASMSTVVSDGIGTRYMRDPAGAYYVSGDPGKVPVDATTGRPVAPDTPAGARYILDHLAEFPNASAQIAYLTGIAAPAGAGNVVSANTFYSSQRYYDASAGSALKTALETAKNNQSQAVTNLDRVRGALAEGQAALATATANLQKAQADVGGYQKTIDDLKVKLKISDAGTTVILANAGDNVDGAPFVPNRYGNGTYSLATLPPGLPTPATPYVTTAPGGPLTRQQAADILAYGSQLYRNETPAMQAKLADIVATAFTAPTTAPGGHRTVAEVEAIFPELFQVPSAFAPDSPTGIFAATLRSTGDADKAYAAYNAAIAGNSPPAVPTTTTAADATLQETLKNLGVTLPSYGPENTAYIAEITKGFSPAGIDFNNMTGPERDAFRAEYKRIFAETKDQTKAVQGAATLVMTTRMQQIHARDAQKFQTDLTSALAFAGDRVYAALAQIDPQLASLVERGVKGAAFVSALVDLANGKNGADRTSILAALKFLGTGVLGEDVAKFAMGISGVISLGDSLKNFRPGGDAVAGTLGAASAVASIFATGLFGKDLQKVGRDVGLGISGASLAYNFIKNPSVVNGLAIGSFILGQVWTTPEGQAVTAGLGLASSFFSSAALGPLLGPIGVALSAIAFVATIVKLFTGSTLKITDSVDASADGVNDKITYKTKKDDWFYEITNGAQTLPFSAVGYKLVAETVPGNTGKVIVGTGRGASSYVEFANADGSTRRVDVRVDMNEDGDYLSGVYTASARSAQRLTATMDSAGNIWVTDPDTRAGAAAPPRVTGYRLEVTAKFKAINDAPSLEGASAGVSQSITREQYDQLLTQLGAPNGILLGDDAKTGALRPFFSGNVEIKQEKKNEGYSYYADFNGDGVLDRVTKFQKIKNETDGDDSMRYQLLTRDGRVIQEWATDKDGNPAPDSRAGRSINGGEYFIDLSGKQVFGRFNIDSYVDLQTGADKTRVRDLSAGGIGLYVGNESSLGDRLEPGQAMTTNQRLISADGSTVMILQADGNLVVYERFADTGEISKVRWSSGTSGSGGNRLVAQGDGNLVLYAGDKAVWASNTVGKGAVRLVVQNDGNAVLYPAAGGAAAWSSGTVDRTSLDIGELKAYGYETPVAVAPPVATASGPAATTPGGVTTAAPNVAAPVAPATIQAPPAGLNLLGGSTVNGVLRANDALLSANGRWLTVFQGDGNLVMYDMLGGMKATWASNTAGKAAGGFAVMQGDGNLVVYAADNSPKWYSGTNGGGANRNFTLAMQDDGNLVVYDTQQGGEALWSSQGGRIAAPEPNTPPAAGWSDVTSLSYIASYPDLMNAFGANAASGRDHFNTFGVKEGRQGTFDAASYMAANPDVAAWAGGDTARAASHFITYGRYEARALAPGQTARTPDINPAAQPVAQSGFTNLGDRISTGGIGTNQYLQSANGQYFAVFQTDGNLVVYRGTPAANGGAIWASNTGGKAPGGSVQMQGDGNLLVYAPGAAPQWASGTDGAGVNRPMTLIMQNDGNLVIYDSQGGEALWSTQTGRIALPEPNGMGNTYAEYLEVA